MKKFLCWIASILLAITANAQVSSRTTSGIDTNSVIGISTGILGTNTFGQIQMPGPTAWTTNWPGGTIGCVSNMTTAVTNGVLSWGTTGAVQVLTAGFYDISYNVSFIDAASASTMRMDVFTNVAGGAPTSIAGGTHGTASTTTYNMYSRPNTIRYLPANTFVSLAMHRIAGTAGGGTISNASLGVVMLRNSTAGGTGASSTNTSSTITNLVWGNTVWVDAAFGNDTTGLRNDASKPFATVSAAKDAAQAGDTVIIRPGTYYNATNLLKNGVRWRGEGLPLLTYTNTTNNGPGWGVFDDRWAGSGGVTSRVEGIRLLWHGGFPGTNAAFQVCCMPTNVLGGIVVTNPLSDVTFDIADYTYHAIQDHAQGVGGVHVKNARRFESWIGTLYDGNMRTNYVVGLDDLGDPIMAGSNGTGYYWEASGEGGVHFNGNVAEGKLYAAWWNAPSTTTTGNVWMTCHDLRGTWYASSTGGGANPLWRSWQDYFEMRDANIIGGGKHYVRTMKGAGTANIPSWDVSGNGELWLTAQKLSSGSSLFRQAGGSAFVSHLNVAQWEDLGGIVPMITVSTGRLHVLTGEATCTNRNFLSVNSGTTTVILDGVTVRSLSTNSPVVLNTNGLTLKNCLLLGTNTHFAVTTSQGAPLNLRALGSFATTDVTNKITIQGGTWTHDTNLTP